MRWLSPDSPRCAPCSGLAKSCDPATALIHASEMERLGPGPVTPSWIVPMAAEVVALPTARRGARRARGRGGVGPSGNTGSPTSAAAWATANPAKDWTSASAGVIEIRLLSASGQSTAALSTECRRSTPAE